MDRHKINSDDVFATGLLQCIVVGLAGKLFLARRYQ